MSIEHLIYTKRHKNRSRARYRFSLMLIYQILQMMASAGGQIRRSRLIYVIGWPHLNDILKTLLESGIIGVSTYTGNRNKPSTNGEVYITEKGKILLRKLFNFNEICPMERL